MATPRMLDTGTNLYWLVSQTDNMNGTVTFTATDSTGKMSDVTLRANVADDAAIGRVLDQAKALHVRTSGY